MVVNNVGNRKIMVLFAKGSCNFFSSLQGYFFGVIRIAQ